MAQRLHLLEQLVAQHQATAEASRVALEAATTALTALTQPHTVSPARMGSRFAPPRDAGGLLIGERAAERWDDIVWVREPLGPALREVLPRPNLDFAVTQRGIVSVGDVVRSMQSAGYAPVAVPPPIALACLVTGVLSKAIPHLAAPSRATLLDARPDDIFMSPAQEEALPIRYLAGEGGGESRWDTAAFRDSGTSIRAELVTTFWERVFGRSPGPALAAAVQGVTLAQVLWLGPHLTRALADTTASLSRHFWSGAHFPDRKTRADAAAIYAAWALVCATGQVPPPQAGDLRSVYVSTHDGAVFPSADGVSAATSNNHDGPSRARRPRQLRGRLKRWGGQRRQPL